MADLVLRERDDAGVVLLRLNRPPLNPLSRALLAALGAEARAVATDPDVKAVVITGSDRAFAAGADISEFGGAERAREIGHAFRGALDAVAAIPRPVLAAIGGFALGGGLELAMACDLRVAGHTAQVGQPELALGIIPGGGATQRLPRLVGPARAKELIWSGRRVPAAEALETGLVDRVVPAGRVVEAALGWAGELARGAVVAMGHAKHAIDAGLDLTLAAGLDVELDDFVAAARTEDAEIGVRSFREHGAGRAGFVGR